MELLHYTNTLFLGKESSDFVDIPLQPGQRLLLGFVGTFFILLSIFETPFQWDEFFYVAIGGSMVFYALLRNRIVSPRYIRFNKTGIRGTLRDNKTIKWTWDQIDTIEYLPNKILVHTRNGDQAIPVGHVAQRHRSQVLDHLEEVANENNVTVKN